MLIRWTRQAQADLQAAFEFIFIDSPQAALAVLDRIEASVDHLARHPEIGRAGRVETTRELVIPNTPYIVVYRHQGNVCEILAVLHASRKWPDVFPNT